VTVHGSRQATVRGKTEDRLFVFMRSRFEVVPLTRAAPPEASVHYLHVSELLPGAGPDELVLRTGMGTFTLHQCSLTVAAEIIRAVTQSLRHVYAAVPLGRLVYIDPALVSPKLAAELAAPPAKPLKGPCDSFWPTYLYTCDFHDEQPRTLGVKEIVEEYHDTRCRTMTADDIGCLDTPYEGMPPVHSCHH
jgi:hypothetical protein